MDLCSIKMYAHNISRTNQFYKEQVNYVAKGAFKKYGYVHSYQLRNECSNST